MISREFANQMECFAGYKMLQKHKVLLTVHWKQQEKDSSDCKKHFQSDRPPRHMLPFMSKTLLMETETFNQNSLAKVLNP